ncbi:hypothetical protein Tco_0011647 [Tanacetum coccineum]
MEECHKLLTDKVDDAILKYNVSKPLPLGGEPGHITIQSDFFFNKDLEATGTLISSGLKMSQDDITASKRNLSLVVSKTKRFYIDRFSSEGDRRAVRTHMRILSVRQFEVFSLYGYNYMKKIILRRADLKEYVIAERDFKYMYPSDFEDLYLLNLQGHLNHLSPDDKQVLTTAVNLWTRNLVIRQRVEDFQLGIESYQTVHLSKNLRWHPLDLSSSMTTQSHKFSDGTLQQIDEALDYRVKEFRVNRTNPGMNTRFWTKKDVSKADFMVRIQNAKDNDVSPEFESIVGGRIREATTGH